MKEIAPQLFARLGSHPDKVVRKQLESLLVMLAKHSPWSLVYPTLVDANSPEKEPSEELQKILAYLVSKYFLMYHFKCYINLQVKQCVFYAFIFLFINEMTGTSY